MIFKGQHENSWKRDNREARSVLNDPHIYLNFLPSSSTFLRRWFSVWLSYFWHDILHFSVWRKWFPMHVFIVNTGWWLLCWKKATLRYHFVAHSTIYWDFLFGGGGGWKINTLPSIHGQNTKFWRMYHYIPTLIC